MYYNSHKLVAITVTVILISSIQTSFAESEPVMITYSDKMNFIEFDGKWTSFSEWKESSLNSIGSDVKIRSAHFGNFIYVFVDVLHDSTLDKGSDRAVICFDPDNSKSITPDTNDFCFISILDRQTGFTLQGGSPFKNKSYFTQIKNHDDLITIGAVSDSNDRYLKTPHPSYEFKIPTELIQRSSNYGFYVETFDANSGESKTWPGGISKNSPMEIPSPKFWGDMISIDKTLPELPLPLLIFTIMILSMIILSRYVNNWGLRINTY